MPRWFGSTLAAAGLIGFAAGRAALANPPEADLPMVQYCDLIRDPSLHDGKKVRLHGVYLVSGMSDSKLFSSACAGGHTTWVEFEPDFRACTEGTLVRRLATMARKSQPRSAKHHASVVIIEYRSAEVDFIGTFHARNPYKRAKSEHTAGPSVFRLDDVEPRAAYDSLFSVSCADRVKELPKGAAF